MTQDPSLHPPSSAIDRSFWLICVFLAAVIFASIAPTLRWLEFSNTPEALNVATAQEIRRTGNWLVPTLQGQSRWAKPPLTAWITALCISNQTMQDISSLDPAIRDKGFIDLQWEVRWPMLLAGCITLLLTAEMGRLLQGSICGIISLIAAGTSLLFLRFARYSNTDILLTLWVAGANVAILHALLRGKSWYGWIIAGLCMGLAVMSKGPVALIASAFPIAIWYAISRNKIPDIAKIRVAPLLVGLLLFAITGLWWFVMVYLRDTSVGVLWLREVTREGATDAPPAKWYTSLAAIPYTMPWIVFFFAGCIAAIAQWRSKLSLALLLFGVPLIVLSLSKDQAARYLLPLLPATGVLAGAGVVAMGKNKFIRAGHWIAVAILGIGFPIAARFLNPPWHTSQVAMMAAFIGAAIVIGGLVGRGEWSISLLFGTLMAMLFVQAIFIMGYRHTREGSAELRSLAESILQQVPDCRVFNAHPRGKRPPPELGVYLNRILEWTDHPENITPASTPQVLLVLQNRGDPDPAFQNGWQLLEKRPRDKDFWWAFVMQPTSR